MCCKGFVVAMHARIVPSPFGQPFLRDAPPQPDWLIVSRWGGHAEYLTISRADAALLPAAGPEAAPAPIGLHPVRTWFGVLTDEAAGGTESTFLLTAHLPPAMPVAGQFAPAEGYARLATSEDGTLRLTAVAREPQPGAAAPPPEGRAWALTAERRPWAGEFLDCAGG